MIAILKKNADENAVAYLVSWIEKKGLTAHVSHGENETIIGLVGDTTKIDPFLLESMDIVQRVQRVSEPFKKANRKFHPADTVVDCGGVSIGDGTIIGAGSVVTKDIPSGVIAAGNPCRVFRKVTEEDRCRITGEERG